MGFGVLQKTGKSLGEAIYPFESLVFLSRGIKQPHSPCSSSSPIFFRGAGLTAFTACIPAKEPLTLELGVRFGGHHFKVGCSGICAWCGRDSVELKVPGNVIFQHFPC